MERYESYKDSGIEWIGEIPEEWTKRRISALYNARNVKVSDRDFPPLSVTMQGILPQLETAAKTQDGDNRKLVKKGDFVINSRSDRRGACGISDRDGSVTLISNVLAPKSLDRMNNRYFSYLFKTEGFADGFYKCGTGIVDDLWSTNWSRMKNMDVCIPGLPEQEAIANWLDERAAEIDSLIAETERSVELLEEYRRSVISEAVTKGIDPDAPMKDSGVEWIGEIPEGWELPKLGLIATVESGATPNREREDYWGGEIPWYKTGELNNGLLRMAEETITETGFSSSSTKLFPAGTLLIAMYGQGKTRGMTGITTTGSCTNQACAGIQVNGDDVNPRYLQYYFIASYFPIREVALGSGQPNLSIDLLNSWKVVVPPYSDQLRIVQRLDSFSEDIKKVCNEKNRYLELLREYRKSLISEAVTGKFKVPGVD